MAKNYVIVKGRVVRMEDSTYNKFAAKHFGATKNQPAPKNTPIELLKFPKPETPKVEPAKIEAPKVLRRKPVTKEPEPVAEPPKVIEAVKIEEPLKTEVKTEPKEVPKPVAVKKTSRKKPSK